MRVQLVNNSVHPLTLFLFLSFLMAPIHQQSTQTPTLSRHTQLHYPATIITYKFHTFLIRIINVKYKHYCEDKFNHKFIVWFFPQFIFVLFLIGLTIEITLKLILYYICIAMSLSFYDLSTLINIQYIYKVV